MMFTCAESHHLQLDESFEKVRAVPEKRCVLILREIPKETPPEVDYTTQATTYIIIFIYIIHTCTFTHTHTPPYSCSFYMCINNPAGI